MGFSERIDTILYLNEQNWGQTCGGGEGGGCLLTGLRFVWGETERDTQTDRERERDRCGSMDG